MRLTLHLRHQVLLSAFIYLDLLIQLLYLLIMLTLSSFKFLDVVDINLFSIFVDSIFPGAK